MRDDWVVYALLFVGGLLYNWLVEYVQGQLPGRHGVTGWLVAVGVAWTLVGLLLLTSMPVFVKAMLCFMCSGVPMILGSMWRYWDGLGAE